MLRAVAKRLDKAGLALYNKLRAVLVDEIVTLESQLTWADVQHGPVKRP
jgi:hypothetical protein